MDKKDLEYFRRLILEKRDDILREMGVIQDSSLNNTSKDASGNDATYSTHMADQGTDAQEREKAFYYAARENKYILYLNEALDRIENGTYGICVSCGRDIPKERLEAVPITQHCVPCKMNEKQ
ncbi:TraR/DksA family transcriptional regulator [candidate division KSB1 bacterium]|nr:TraR/DksA family transcriptional regulator [candidate division KSB1 bacterium]